MNIKFNNKRVAENIWKTLSSSNNDKRQKRNFHSSFILEGKFLLYSKDTLKEKDPEVKPKKKKTFLRQKSKKCCMRCKRLTCGCFTLNRKSVYLNLICKKQIIIKPVQSQHAIQRDTWVLQTLFQKPQMSVMETFDCIK